MSMPEKSPTIPAEPKKGLAPQNNLLVLGKITAILDAFTLTRPVLSLADLREATGLPTSTVQRLVANLVGQGFLDRDQDSYRIGLKLAYWAGPATRGLEILDVLRPQLERLRDTTEETVCLFRPEQGYRVCVGLAETRHALRREMHLGKILPLHAGSAGRVLLAWDQSLLEETLASPLDPITGSTITRAKELRAAVAQTRADGYAITRDERDLGASGLSAPVFNAAAQVVAALTISGPTVRMPHQKCQEWVEPLLEAAEAMTRLLNGRFPNE